MRKCSFNDYKNNAYYVHYNNLNEYLGAYRITVKIKSGKFELFVSDAAATLSFRYGTNSNKDKSYFNKNNPD